MFLSPKSKNFIVFLSAVAAAEALATPGSAQRAAGINAFLSAFDTDSATVMDQQPRKAKASRSAFSQEQIQSGAFVTAKDQVRSQQCTIEAGAKVCLKDVAPGRAPFEANDRAEKLVDRPASMLRDLRSMEARRLTSAELPVQPWSDDYWALYQGALGARYADRAFPRSENFGLNKRYVDERTVGDILMAANSSSVDTLSPAEKYDLLVGDKSGTFTKANWAQGESYFKNYGKVETWMGLCHGWAPAAYMLPRPRHSVKVLAADGRTKIRFYPADIKALATSLWANVRTPSKFIGGRCDDKAPKKEASGRVISEECFDNNPGTFHMAIVNQIGVAKRSTVMDATFDYEVWNHPILSYDYTYFNPKTRRAVKTINEGTVELSGKDSWDKFAEHRSEEAAQLVGVSMEVTYLVETTPDHSKVDSEEADETNTVTYEYDLELDANGKIIGGEWYTNKHPDFMWTPPVGTRAVSSGDRFALGSWDVSQPFPMTWSMVAKRTSQAGQPIAKVVEALVAAAQVQALE